MRIALTLRKLGLNSDVLHSLGFGLMLAAISLWGLSASVSDWRAKARTTASTNAAPARTNWATS